MTELTRYTLPAHWADPLLNGDSSGMTDEDEAELFEWLNSARPGGCVGVEGEPEFRPFNDADTLAGECLTFYFQEFA
jgi:hypothetical protein